MAEFVIAPILKPLENRMETKFRVTFELTEDRDVARVADLLAQIGSVENEFRLEVVILLGARQKAKINPNAKVLQRVIDEASMAAFITRHD